MDAKGQKAVRIEINDICDKYCSNCIFNVSRGVSDCTPKQQNKKGEIVSYNIPCPISDQLKKLGKQLILKKPDKRTRKKRVRPLHAKYIKFFESGLTDKEIMEIMKVTRSAVHYQRKEWRKNKGE